MGNGSGGGERMNRNLRTQKKKISFLFLNILNSFFFPLRKIATLHDLGPGHPGTLAIELKRSADPPGNNVPPVHRPPPPHGDDHHPTLPHGEVHCTRTPSPSNTVIKL